MSSAAQDRAVRMLEHYIKEVTSGEVSPDIVVLYTITATGVYGTANWAGLSYDKQHDMLSMALKNNVEFQAFLQSQK